MATIYSLKDLGRVFDFTLPGTINPVNVVSQKIIFYKPNGIRFEKTATIQSDVVTYDNSSPDESILDLRGPWSYTAQIVLDGDGDTLEVPEKILLWVS